MKIDKVDKITHKEFYHEYVVPQKPVVVTSNVLSYPAFGKLTPEYFAKKYGHLKKEIGGVTYTLEEIVSLMKTSSAEKTSPYPCDMHIDKVFPEVLQYLQSDFIYGKVDRINHGLMPKAFTKATKINEMFFGGKGSFFPFLHIDAMFLHTQITQLYGDKEFFMIHLDQTEKVYPRDDNPKISSVRNIFNPDLEKYPKFKNAEISSVMVKEGETIFFTSQYWHTTKIHSECISYGRVHLNPTNWEGFMHDNYELFNIYHPRLIPFAKAYAFGLDKLMKLQEALR